MCVCVMYSLIKFMLIPLGVFARQLTQSHNTVYTISPEYNPSKRPSPFDVYAIRVYSARIIDCVSSRMNKSGIYSGKIQFRAKYH